jgi:A/G-specific adenine glycosylase
MSWGRANRRLFPWRETADPFRVLVAEVLLQRSRGITVEKVYRRLFDRWPDAPSLARAQERSIASVIRPLGLVKRAASLKALAGVVAESAGVPDSVEELLQLPGVGMYAASATLAVAFGKRAAVVDGVTARVYRRYFALDPTLAPPMDRVLWQLVSRVTPRRHIAEWNWAVLDLASSICLPRVPRCQECPLESHCAWSLAVG